MNRKTLTYSSPRFVLLLSLSLLALLFSACSATSGGGTDGDEVGRFSDADLAGGEARFADGNIPVASENGLFQDIRFGYDSSVIPREYYEALRNDAKMIQADSTLRVEVEGHCDKRGTNEYNLALGEERAKAVAALLVSFGVNPDQLTTISYGEEIPIDPANDEAAYAKNRRVHFAMYRNKR